MATFNELIRSRRALWRDVKRKMRAVDSAQESAERLVNRVIARKRNVPTEADLSRLSANLADVAQKLAILADTVSRGYAL